MSAGQDRVFYDGGCGLCHASVRFLLRRDPGGTRFVFAPIGGAAWRERFPPGREAPCETMVVVTPEGETLERSTAALHLARRLSRGWRLLARLGGWVPRPLRDLAYRGVARVRRLLFPRPKDACPALDPALRPRFDLRP